MAKVKVADSRKTLMGNMLAATKKALGDSTALSVDEFKQTHRGIEIPSIAFQYVLGVNALPMERVMELFSEPGVGKSALGFEIGRWFLNAMGMCAILETENKLSTSLLASIQGPDSAEYTTIYPCTIVEGTHKIMSRLLDNYAKLCPDLDVPYFIQYDSVAGNKAKSTLETQHTDGHGKKSYSEEAALMSKLMSGYSDFAAGKPVYTVLINHETETMAGGGGGMPFAPPPKDTKCGKAVKFFATHRIRLTSMGKSTESKTEGANKLIRITAVKNSMGIEGRRMDVRMHWTVDETNKQTTWFDWDAADAALLTDEVMPKTAMKNFIEISASKNEKGRYSCKEVGIKDGTAKELMTAIRANTEVYNKLRGILGIQLINVYNPSKKPPKALTYSDIFKEKKGEKEAKEEKPEKADKQPAKKAAKEEKPAAEPTPQEGVESADGLSV